MPKTNCNIIKDLLPSYQDELCSIESKQLIEEHFEECSSCKKLYEQTSLEFTYSNSTAANTKKELDYFKTIRMNVNKKNRTLLVVTSILFFLQLYFNFNSYLIFTNSNIISYTNYVFPLLIAGALFAVLPDFTEHFVPNKIKLPILGVEFTGMTYMFALMTFVGYTLLKGNLPFGIPSEKVGPFLIVQILVLTICFIVAFIATLIISLRNKAVCPALCFLPLGGLSLMFEYRHLLHELDSRFSLKMFIRPYVILVLEVILLVGIYMLINRKKTTC